MYTVLFTGVQSLTAPDPDDEMDSQMYSLVHSILIAVYRYIHVYVIKGCVYSLCASKYMYMYMYMYVCTAQLYIHIPGA